MAMASLSFHPPSVTVAGGSATATAGNVFEMGKFTVGPIEEVGSASTCCLNCAGRFAPPKPVVIGHPEEDGEFPVVLLMHGYLLCNTFYRQLIRHIVSHGFIVVAPQLYTVTCQDTGAEIKALAAIGEWLPEGLRHYLPAKVSPNLKKLALAGHSRGGKVAFAFALALNKSTSSTAPKVSAIIGLDPVDGSRPPILTGVSESFDFVSAMPVLVIGSGLGELQRNPLFPPCGPKGVNHEEFFKECRSPAHYMVVKDYGHMDLLDDETRGIRGKGSYCMCKNGESRGPMRSFVGGAVVAFLKAYLEGKEEDLRAIEDGSLSLPVQLQTLQVRL
ncbi:chlorophyllase-2, chloroplastic-like [Momordica charantia]|uniref:Chlorophyllase-2, chloroplastic-like n=1 Tax=Momordica charantia TaxID=3673 RepID=A0A6J1CA40_MOMCH|nr:chlorophyllase-2, chloroplastic-like [Momordica charantia]